MAAVEPLRGGVEGPHSSHTDEKLFTSDDGGSKGYDEVHEVDKQQDWTEEEEKNLVHKLDFILMPLLILGFFALQFDRGNIGNALTDNFLKDVGITQSNYNVGNQLLSLGIVLLEIPSNLILYRLGPRAWISSQIFAWGMVATFQAFQKGVAAYMITRLLLGMCESGFIPASLYCMTTFYKREETSKRFGIFFIGNFGAQAVAGLAAYGILHMRGIANLAGWQWLFILEGLFTILVSFVYVALFPRDPAHPIPYSGIKFFNERESYILAKRIILDDPSKQKKRSTITKQELKATLGDWKVYTHVIMTIAGLAPSNTMTQYAPTLVQSFGYGKLRSNAIASIGNWILTVLVVTWGVMADKFKSRGPLVVAGLIPWWAFTVGSLTASYHPKEEKARLACLLLGIGFSNVWHPVNASWMALNARSPGERSIRMAMVIMSANAAGIIGSQLFQASDKPYYHKGWTAIVIVTSVGVLMSFAANFQYWWLNRRLEAAEARGEDTTGPDGKKFRYRT